MPERCPRDFGGLFFIIVSITSLSSRDVTLNEQFYPPSPVFPPPHYELSEFDAARPAKLRIL